MTRKSGDTAPPAPHRVPEASLLAQVNETGFPLQLAVAATLRDSYARTGWDVIATEFPVNDGFVDLVIRKGRFVGLVECKRSLDDDWIFLPETSANVARCRVEVFEADKHEQGKDPVRCAELTTVPASLEAEFCCLPRKRPLRMLENVARELVLAANATARLTVDLERENTWEAFVPIVVTTARLSRCTAANRAALTTGRLDDASFEEIPFIRFKKSFVQHGAARTRDGRPLDLGRWKGDRERTVFVVHAENFVDFLAGFHHAGMLTTLDPLNQPR